jgi:hypothetical protein
MSRPTIIFEPNGFIIDDLKLSNDLIRSLKDLRDPDTIQFRNTLSRNCLLIAANDADGMIDRKFYSLLNIFYEILQHLDDESAVPIKQEGGLG